LWSAGGCSSRWELGDRGRPPPSAGTSPWLPWRRVWVNSCAWGRREGFCETTSASRWRLFCSLRPSLWPRSSICCGHPAARSGSRSCSGALCGQQRTARHLRSLGGVWHRSPCGSPLWRPLRRGFWPWPLPRSLGPAWAPDDTPSDVLKRMTQGKAGMATYRLGCQGSGMRRWKSIAWALQPGGRGGASSGFDPPPTPKGSP
jgi:hypothetical protein